MTTKFNLGETTGFKANPSDVAKAMTTRDYKGDHMFTNEEILTTQQVSSFFSRLASKKKLPDVQDDDDAIAAENETDLQDLQEMVVQEVSLQHPIIYDRHNMCELISNSKMKRFAVPMLNKLGLSRIYTRLYTTTSRVINSVNLLISLVLTCLGISCTSEFLWIL